MAILAICCLWIVTDVAYGVRMWELGVDAWIGRIKALAIILIGVSLSYLFFNYLANTFLDRNKERRSRPVFREYLWVVLFNLVQTYPASLYPEKANPLEPNSAYY